MTGKLRKAVKEYLTTRAAYRGGGYLELELTKVKVADAFLESVGIPAELPTYWKGPILKKRGRK